MTQVALREKKLQNGRSSLYLDYQVNGKRKYEYLKLYLFTAAVLTTEQKRLNKLNREAAIKIKAERELQLLTNPFGIVNATARKLPALEYVKAHAISETRKDTARWYAKFLHNRSTFPIGQIDGQHAKDFASYLSQHLAASTAHNLFVSWRAIIYQAINENLCPAQIFPRGTAPKKPRAKIDYLTRDEVAKVAAALPEHIARPFLFCCLTGLRHSDVYKLTWAEVSTGSIISTQKKTGEPINVPLNDQARELMGAPGNPKDRIFNVPTCSRANSYLRALHGKVEVNKRLHWHITRHTFAVWLLSAGTSIYVVSRLLGHTNIQTTIQHYANLQHQARTEAIQNLPTLNF